MPSPNPSQPSTSQIDAAIADIRMRDYPAQRYHAVEVAQGTAIYIWPIDSPGHAVEVAQLIATAVGKIGFTGIVTACADRLGPRPRTGRNGFSAAVCAADAAIDHRDTPLAFRAVKKHLDRWAVDSKAFQDIVGFLVSWAETNTVGPILAGHHFTMSRCEPRQVAGVITRCCEDIGWADLTFPTAQGDRSVYFSPEGWIVVSIETKPSQKDGRNALLVLLEDMAPFYDYAAITYGYFGMRTPRVVMIQHGVPSASDIDLSSDHALMKSAVPGIFGAQVLGPGHPDLQPSGYWRITAWGNGRRLFTAPNAKDWWTTQDLHPEEGFDSLRAANSKILDKWG